MSRPNLDMRGHGRLPQNAMLAASEGKKEDKV